MLLSPRHRIAVGLVSSLLLLPACSDGGIELPSIGTGDPTATDPPAATDPAATDPPTATDPAPTEPPATDPPATEPPATDPPSTEAPASAPSTTEPDDGEGGISPEALLLIVLGLVALFGIGALLLRRRPTSDGTAAAPMTDPRRQFVATGRVRLEFDGERQDKFGRYLAYVWVDDKMLNEELLRRGFARHTPWYPYSDAMKKRLGAVEREAKRQRRGLWSAK